MKVENKIPIIIFTLHSVLFVKIQYKLSEIAVCGAEMLFIDMFGHDVQQPSPCHEVGLFLTSPENTFHEDWKIKTVAR